MTPHEALNEIYKATRTMSGGAEAHEHMNRCYGIVFNVLQQEEPKPAKKEEKNPAKETKAKEEKPKNDKKK